MQAGATASTFVLNSSIVLTLSPGSADSKGNPISPTRPGPPLPLRIERWSPEIQETPNVQVWDEVDRADSTNNRGTRTQSLMVRHYERSRRVALPMVDRLPGFLQRGSGCGHFSQPQSVRRRADVTACSRGRCVTFGFSTPTSSLCSRSDTGDGRRTQGLAVGRIDRKLFDLAGRPRLASCRRSLFARVRQLPQGRTTAARGLQHAGGF